jgi:4-amino-4-deoxy-L-arabinose transferase-like glycosyltransferase
MKRYIPLLLAILLFAVILRLYRLDAQSFWNDEGNSARLSERPLNLILEGTASDIHPPAYYVLLHYWRALFGQSEFALRCLSVVAGLALVAFTYLLGRHLFDEATGLAAAFLGAISPFTVYYSQEARMYALVAALSAVSVYLLLRLLNLQAPHRLPVAAVYVVTCALGLYTQYTFPFILLAHNVIFVLWWLTTARRSESGWRWLALWAGGQAAIVALYLPWLSIALRSVTGWPAAEGAYGLGRALLDVFNVLTVGVTMPVEEATAALVGAGVLLLAGLWFRRAERFGVASTAVYLLLPIGLIFAFDLYKHAWLKFLIIVLPPFHILVARGVENLVGLLRHATRNASHTLRLAHHVVRVLLLLTLAVLAYPSLYNLYFDPTYARDNYRQIAADIATVAAPNTAIILNAPNQWEVFTYYYPDRDVYPTPYHPTPDDTERYLAPLAERYQRLFVLYWGDAESDPQQLVERWLAANTHKATDTWYGRVRLATYAVASLPDESATVLDAPLGESIQLNGYAVAGDSFAPGDVLPVLLLWEAETPIPERYKVTVQVLDAAGQLVAQHDSEPSGGFAPTDGWVPGQVVVDRHGVLLPTDLAPGHYSLVVALYNTVGGERLPTATGADHLLLETVKVTPAQ